MTDLRFVPLTQWPGEPTKYRRDAQFRSSYAKTLDLLENELHKIGAKEITVQAFFRMDQIRNDGWPYSAARPSAPGVILSFRTKAGALSFPCDQYRTIDDNLRAIALSLTALRAVDRYGVTKRAEQYAGWKRIEAPKPNGFDSKTEAALFIISQQDTGVTGGAYTVVENPEKRQEVYRRAAKRLHPDNPDTGNSDLFVKLQQALSLLETNP